MPGRGHAGTQARRHRTADAGTRQRHKAQRTDAPDAGTGTQAQVLRNNPHSPKT